MRSKTWLVRVALVCLAVWLGPVLAPAATLTPLSTQERAAHNATHLVVIDHKDLTETSTNTTQTLTNLLKVAANTGVELVKMELVTAFQDDATNAFNSLALIVGDGTDDDVFLGSTELNVYGTEVYMKRGRTIWSASDTNTFIATATAGSGTFVTGFTPTLVNVVTGLTFTTGDVHGTNYLITATPVTTTAVALLTTNTFAALTNLTTTTGTAVGGTAASSRQKLYTAADYVDFKFTPSPLTYALADLDQGEVRLYFKIE